MRVRRKGDEFDISPSDGGDEGWAMSKIRREWTSAESPGKWSMRSSETIILLLFGSRGCTWRGLPSREMEKRYLRVGIGLIWKMNRAGILRWRREHIC